MSKSPVIAPTDAYSALLTRMRELRVADSIEQILDWDSETYMPRGAAAHRGEQAALIAGVAHERRTSDELGALLERAARETGGDPVRETNVREMRRVHERAVKLPTALVQEIARSTTVAKEAWSRARADRSFSAFAPHLQQILDLKRQVAERVGWDSEPYDALMDEFEPQARAADVQRVFDELKRELVPLVQALTSAKRQPDLALLSRPAAVEGQQRFNRLVSEAMGFDFTAGRLDISTHPFCTGITTRDVRLTTRYNERYMPQSLFGVMHEVGHGLYEQGFLAEHEFTPMAAAVSLGIHESQSRMWENMVGRSAAFWRHFYPRLQAEFDSYRDVPESAWVFAINNVRPSLIRVEADEVTYGLHIMLRFEIERRMIAGKLAVADIPQAWNEGVRSLLGITPPDDAAGCLQDIHWSLGIFGYFPTYQLGNLYAAQLYAAAERAMPDLEAKIAAGQMRPLLDWLRTNVHHHGRRYRAHELVKVVSGSELSPRPFLDYLNGKYRALYGV